MKRILRATALVAVSIAALATGCSHMHRVANKGDTTLYAVNVKSGAYMFGHGVLPPSIQKTYDGSMRIGYSRLPIISWKTNMYGQVFSQSVQLNRWPPWGEVVFELDGQTVKGHRQAR